MKKVLLSLCGIVAVLALVGCEENPTNAPSDEAVIKANQDRAAAIDNDPKLSPEQKAKMKEMMGLDKVQTEPRK